MSKKILFLHGFAQSGSMFAKKSSGLRKALKKAGYETVYLDGPVQVSISDLPFDTSASKFSASEEDAMKSWWPNNEAAADHYRIDQALQSVKESIQENGPYAGIVGFSQGAGFAGILSQAIQTLHEKQPPLLFAVFYSGFRTTPDFLQHYYDTPITIPTLHVMGTMDTVVSEERSMKLYEASSPETRALLKHPGGHFVPNAKDIVQKVVAFIENATKVEDPVPEAPESKEKENWDEFDKIGA